MKEVPTPRKEQARPSEHLDRRSKESSSKKLPKVQKSELDFSNLCVPLRRIRIRFLIHSFLSYFSSQDREEKLKRSIYVAFRRCYTIYKGIFGFIFDFWDRWLWSHWRRSKIESRPNLVLYLLPFVAFHEINCALLAIYCFKFSRFSQFLKKRKQEMRLCDIYIF